MHAAEVPYYGEHPLKTLLRDFTYRPDWSFRFGNGFLVITAKVVDTNDFSFSTQIAFSQAVPQYFDLRPDFDWVRWLFDQIMTVERHEAQEFFRVKGVQVYDPHKGER